MEQVFATKGNLIALQKSLLLAKRGFELMDRKNSILMRETMALVDTATQLQTQIDSTYAAAYAALQRANVTLGIVDSIAAAVPIEEGVQLQARSVMGVELPTVTLAEPERRVNPYGYHNTNALLDQAFVQFDEVKKLTAKLAEIETSVYRLALAIQKTQKRANALKNIIIPKFTKQVKEISEVLEEKTREEFSRMKVIKEQKNQAES